MRSFIQAAATSLPDGEEFVLVCGATGVWTVDACIGVNAVVFAPYRAKAALLPSRATSRLTALRLSARPASSNASQMASQG